MYIVKSSGLNDTIAPVNLNAQLMCKAHYFVIDRHDVVNTLKRNQRAGMNELVSPYTQYPGP